MFFDRFHQTPTDATRRTTRREPYDPEAVRRRARGADGPFGGARLGF